MIGFASGLFVTRGRASASATLTQPHPSTSQRFFHWQEPIYLYHTIHAMAGATDARNRSESQEQDEVRTQLSLHNTNPCDAEVGISSNRTTTARTMNKGRARQNQVGRRTQSTAIFLLVLSSFVLQFPPLSWSPCLRCAAFSFFPGSLCSSQAARRDQNRIAQREFRLRKQQRVRATSVPVVPAMTGQVESRLFG